MVSKIKSENIRQSFWGQELAEVSRVLDTNIDKGLEEEESIDRVSVFGSNRFGGDEGPSTFSIFARQFQSPIIIILILASVTTVFLDKWADASIIMLAVVINTFLGFYQENKAERAIADLRSYIQERARVIRGGVEREVDASTLVPGDLIHISHGMRVPADARLVSIQNLLIDESILTGESLPVAKETDSISEAAIVTERRNMVFGGTLVTEGSAHAIVTATGSDTEIGKLAKLVVETRQERTPLQKAVSWLAWVIVFGVSLLVSGIFVLGVSRGEPVVDMLVVSIATVVGAIPEALPVGLTAVLAVGIQRIAKRRGIMRNLAASETLGSTSVIIVDKTGTLTEAKMKLTEVIITDELESDKPYDHIARGGFSEEQKELLLLAILNTDVVIENPSDKPEEWQIGGRALEANIVRAAAQEGIDVFHPKDRSRMVLSFSSVYKFSVAKSNGFLVAMGAPEILLKRSNMSKDAYVSISNRIEEMSGRGRRLLGIAVLPIQSEDTRTGNIKPELLEGLTFKGIVGFQDPVREDVPETLNRIEKYGVRVVMATGDLKGTALSVAGEIGWQVKEGDILTGEELKQLDDKELSKALAHVRIFARVTPEDKLRIAKLYQKRGEVVAMTGDGVNDAPSLKAADIGIAVGSGSDVAKGVADLVLLDDKFSTIVAAIEEGKRMLLNIRKIFVYLMSNSLDVVILIGGSLLTGLALPVSAIQIIWVNLFTGGLPAIAYAFDKDGDLEIGKKGRSAILDNEVKFLTLGIGILTSFLLFGLYWTLIKMSVDLDIARSFIFACLASYILVISFSIRNLGKPIYSYPLFENKLLVSGVALGLSLLAATMYVPVLQVFFGTVTLAPIWMALLAGWMVLNIFLVEAAKWLFYRADK